MVDSGTTQQTWHCKATRESVMMVHRTDKFLWTFKKSSLATQGKLIQKPATNEADQLVMYRGSSIGFDPRQPHQSTVRCAIHRRVDTDGHAQASAARVIAGVMVATLYKT